MTCLFLNTFLIGARYIVFPREKRPLLARNTMCFLHVLICLLIDVVIGQGHSLGFFPPLAPALCCLEFWLVDRFFFKTRCFDWSCSRHLIPLLEKKGKCCNILFKCRLSLVLRSQLLTTCLISAFAHQNTITKLALWWFSLCIYVCIFYKSQLQKWNIPIAQSIMDYSLNRTLCFFCLTTHTGLGKTRWFVQLKHSVAYTLEGREAISKGSARHVFTAWADKTRKIRRWIAYPLKVSVLVCCCMFCLILLCLFVDKINDSQKMPNFLL